MYKILKGNKGITLVELMIVLALLGVILASGYLFFDFGTSTYARGEERSNVQREMRLASDYITQQLRYADFVRIKPGSGMPPDYHYIYLTADGSIVHRDVSGDERVLIDSALDNIAYNLLFQENADYMVSYRIFSDEIDFDIESDIYVLNLMASIDSGTGDGSMIQFTRPETPVWEYISAERAFWRNFVKDFYENSIDKAHEEFYADSNIETGELAINIEGSGIAYGALLFKDVKPYLDSIEGADIDNYTITMDAQTFTGEGGWGVLINGFTFPHDDSFKDHGYMFQFDPGARGFVLRRIKSGSHNTPGDIGAEMISGENYSLRFGAVYAPEHIINEDFSFDSTISNLDGGWYKRYQTVINVERIYNENDPTKPDELRLRVHLVDATGNKSNEMLFGDFGTITMNDGSVFEGQKLGFEHWNDVGWNGEGTIMGLRSWEREGGEHANNFYGIDLGPGLE